MGAERKARRVARRTAVRRGKAASAEEARRAVVGRVAYEVAVSALPAGTDDRKRAEKILGNMRHLEVATLAPAMRAARIAIREEMKGRTMSRGAVNQWLDDHCNAHDEVRTARRTYVELDAELRALLGAALPRYLGGRADD